MSETDSRSLSEFWTGEALFPILNVESDFDKAFGKTKTQTTTWPLNVHSHIWHIMYKKQQRYAQEYWADVLAGSTGQAAPIQSTMLDPC